MIATSNITDIPIAEPPFPSIRQHVNSMTEDEIIAKAEYYKQVEIDDAEDALMRTVHTPGRAAEWCQERIMILERYEQLKTKTVKGVAIVEKQTK